MQKYGPNRGIGAIWSAKKPFASTGPSLVVLRYEFLEELGVAGKRVEFRLERIRAESFEQRLLVREQRRAQSVAVALDFKAHAFQDGGRDVDGTELAMLCAGFLDGIQEDGHPFAVLLIRMGEELSGELVHEEVVADDDDERVLGEVLFFAPVDEFLHFARRAAQGCLVVIFVRGRSGLLDALRIVEAVGKVRVDGRDGYRERLACFR